MFGGRPTDAIADWRAMFSTSFGIMGRRRCAASTIAFSASAYAVLAQSQTSRSASPMASSPPVPVSRGIGSQPEGQLSTTT